MRLEIRIIFLLLILFSFYQLGMPLEIIAILGVIFLIFILFRDKIRKTVDARMHAHIPGFKDLHPWAKAVIFFIVLIVIYMALKQIIYFMLLQFGYDIQAIILDAIEKSQKQA